MELQVPHRVCAEVQKEDSLQPETGNRREDFEETVRMEGSGDNRGVCPDHIHMLVAIPPKLSVSSFMGYLKGKSSLELFDTIPELKNKYRNREFWCRGYYVDTAGKNADRIKAYIQQQLEEDKLGEQMSLFGK